MDFSERLKRLRTANFLSQKRLSEMLNITDRTLRKYEAKNIEPTLSILIAMANYFHVSLDFLVGRSDDFLLLEFKDTLKDKISELVELTDISFTKANSDDLKHISDVFFSDNFTFDFLCDFGDKWGISLNSLLGFDEPSDFSPHSPDGEV